MFSIDKYNSQVSKIYLSDPNFFMYSAALCRCEGITNIYFRLSKNKKINFFTYFICIPQLIAKIIRDIIFISIARKNILKNYFDKNSIIIISFFDERNNNKGILEEEYFRKILKNNKNVICLYKLTTPGFYTRGKKYIKQIDSLEKNFDAFSEYNFIGYKMILSALTLNFKHLLKFLRFRFPKKINKNLINFMWHVHLMEILNGTVYNLYLQNRLYSQILETNPSQILSVWENQPYMRIIEYLKKTISPHTVSKGFQHTGFSKKLLQHYPTKAEKKLISYPDILITNGIINQKELKQNCNINSKIIVGGALRQMHLIGKKLNLEKLSKENLNGIAYAFSWEKDTYNEILSHLATIPKSIDIYLKFHPLYPEWILKNDFPSNFINTQESWPNLAKKCQLALVNDNSIMFEGYFHGMHTAIYDGHDYLKLEKRDFSSPILHLNKIDLAMINSDNIIKKINASTSNVIKTKYLDKYFYKRNLKELKDIFLK